MAFGLLRYLALVALLSPVQSDRCEESGHQELIVPEVYFTNGQQVSFGYTGFNSPRLLRTDPRNLNFDILSYNGEAFTIKNSFDIDEDEGTKGRKAISFQYELVCGSRVFIWDISIINENDEVPLLVPGIPSPNFHVDVSELSTLGQILPFTFRGKVIDPDPDDTLTFTMRIYPSSAGNSFPFRMINPVNYGDIQVNDTLDFEDGQRQFVYQVFVDDLVGHRLTLLLVISIVDGDDLLPRFNRTSYAATIPEDFPVDERVPIAPGIAAFDQDVEVATPLFYSFQSGHVIGSVAYFRIDVQTAEVFLLRTLDWETKSSFNIQVRGSQRQNPERYVTVPLTITVSDVNDNAPQFERSVYTARLSEHSQVGTIVVTFVATDNDQGAELSFTMSQPSPIFRMEAIDSHRARLVVKNSDLLDREVSASLTLTVLVADSGGLTDQANVRISLNDINDKTPQFTQSVYSFPPIKETSTVNHYIGRVEASDDDVGDNAQIKYRLVSVRADGRTGFDELFSLDEFTGVIRVASNLSVIYIPFYELRLEAYDLGTPSRSSLATVRVEVSDENTNRPVFAFLEYRVSVSEGTAVGSTIQQVSASDADAGSVIAYQMSATWIYASRPEDKFTVVNDTGEILLKDSLDRETDSELRFQISAFDGFYHSYPAATIYVTVTDVNDNSPLFSGQYRWLVAEGCETRMLGSVSATDADVGLNAQLIYHMDDAGFIIEGESGEITVTRCLDREERSSLALQVMARDRGTPMLSGSTSVVLTITDINDNKPVFTQDVYVLTYREGFQGNIDLPPVLDADLPPNDEYTISMISGDDEYFRLTADVIEVLKPLNVPAGIELTTYNIGLRVMNKRQYVGATVPDSTTIVRLDVTSVNSADPQFTRSVYFSSIQESMRTGIDVVQLSASDGDGDVIQFSFSPGTPTSIQNLFWLDQNTGAISLKTELDSEDSELSGPFIFSVKAEDPYGRSSQATVNITVEDINDNEPVITMDRSVLTLSESTEPGYILPVELAVTDRDSFDNGRLTCTLATEEYFTLRECRTIELTRAIDYEAIQSLVLQIRATDHGQPPLTSSERLLVHILAVNDNRPEFELADYSFSVSENVPGRVSIGTVRATDRDKEILTYWLQPGSANGYFSITEFGVLYSNKALDREAVPEHNFLVVASDGFFNTSVVVTITVLDQNDNAPVFTEGAGTYFINENETNTYIVQVVAVDDQDEGDNARLQYEILSGNDNNVFKINTTTGVVSVARPYGIDYEIQREYRLVLQAKDMGFPTQFGTLGITIKVRDVNEFAPVFTQDDYRSTISESSPVGTLVSQLSASDEDGSGEVIYNLIDTVYFSVNTRGVVSTATLLDADTIRQHNVAVEACDIENLCTQVMLVVFVTDVNDNVPEFGQFDDVFNVTEDTPPGTELVQVVAWDADRDDTLTYWLTRAHSLLDVDSRNGSVFVIGAPRATERSLYEPVVYVSDGKHQISQQLTISIREANIHSPEFSLFAYHKTFCETDTEGVVIMSFIVQDPDPGLDGRVRVEITSGNWQDSFFVRKAALSETRFELVNRKPLIYSERPFYELQLEATDGARYPRSGYAIATITLLSGSRAPPVLQQVVTDKITVSNNALPGDIVYTFVALVKNSEERTTLRFTVEPESTDYVMNERAGHLHLNSSDPARETLLNVSACTFTSSACFGGNLTQLCNTLLVLVTVEVAPALPIFHPTNYYVGYLTENQPASHILSPNATQSTGEPINITLVNNELYGDLFVLTDGQEVWSTAAVDREYQAAYNLLLVAYGLAGVTTANVHIKVRDMNDEPPVFMFSVYRVETTESQTYMDREITVVTVVDEDSEADHRLVNYEIEPSSDSDLFYLEPDGQQCRVRLTDKLEADVPTNDTVATVIYSINIRAYDPDDPYMSSTTTVQVQVRDDNDNDPVFEQTVYYLQVEEGNRDDEPRQLGILRATDIDRVDIGRLRYALYEDTDVLFVDPLYGTIYLNHTLDKETNANYTFTAVCLDSSNRTGTARIDLYVVDRNDNRPVFLNTSFDFNVIEGSSSLQSYRLLVEDADFDDNALLSFSKAGRSCDKFELRDNQVDEHLYELHITVVIELDREDNSVPHFEDGSAVYSCLISASDHGTVPLSNSMMVSINVGDENDSPPVFTSERYDWALTEVSPVGFLVGVLTYTDEDFLPEHQLGTFQITYQDDNLFAINSSNGAISLARAISSSQKDITEHALKVQITDPANSTYRDEADVYIRVLDSNDNSPIFKQPRYIFTISEQSTSDIVGQVQATDNDTDPWNSVVVYELIFFGRETLPFTINDTTGVIKTTNVQLDLSASFLFSVRASDKGLPPQSSQAIVEVKVVAFSTSAYTGTVDEGSVLNQTVDIRPPIYAVDTSAVSTIVYSIQPNDGHGLFSVDPQSGLVFVNTLDPHALDYEIQSIYHLKVIAGDRFGSGVAANLTINILDVNDNPPVFSQSNYNFTVSESAYNAILGRVTASDIDTTEDITYRLTNDTGPFLIDAFTGVLRVTGGLDSEIQDFYAFHVEAIDRDNPLLSDLAAIFIQVHDINDNSPIFTQESYTWFISESSPDGFLVGEVTAGDQENDTLIYSIATNSTDMVLPFEINRLTGEIIVAGSLDRERVSEYRFIIKAEDSSLANYTQININLLDVNDNAPTFSDTTYYGSTVEMSQQDSVVLVVFASDVDQPETSNSRIEYKLTGLAEDLFKIDQYGIVKVAQVFTRFTLIERGLITDSRPVIILMVTASDYGTPKLEGSSIIQISVTDQTEDIPTFSQKIYAVNQRENVQIGTEVVNQEARVSDMTGVQMKYRLIGSNPSFRLFHERTGRVVTNRQLNRENAAYFVYTLEARDGRTPERTGYTTITITVTDANDNAPIFREKKMELSRSEGLHNNVTLVQVRATDLDIGDNGRITYTIVGGSEDERFAIDPVTGIITVDGMLDYEKEQQHHLTVEASDNGNPKLTDSFDFYLYITDVNDNAPRFVQPYGPYTIRENTLDVVVDTLEATDPDTGYNGEVHYKITGGNTHAGFLLDEINSTATLSVRHYLDYEKVKDYNISLVAFDLGRPSQSSEITIRIIVQDVSDTRPYFDQPLHEVFIKDNLTVGDEIPLQLSAGYGDFHYNISNGNLDGTLEINSTNGRLFIAKELVGGTEFWLTVQATDYTLNPSSAVTQVKIVVLDTDPMPRFAKDLYLALVAENLPPPQLIFDLITSDEQLGRAVQYEIVDGNFGNLFTLDEPTGRLFTAHTFDREAQHEYYLTVRANRVARQQTLESVIVRRSPDDGSGEVSEEVAETSIQALTRHERATNGGSDVTTIKVQIQDMNDNPPVFVTEATIGIVDNAGQNEVVGTILATDPDAGDNATIAYELTDSSQYFSIAADSGDIVQLGRSLTQSQFKLSVAAVDNRGHSSGLRTVKLFNIIVTSERSRTSYTVLIPINDLPNNRQLQGNLSRILDMDIRVESVRRVSGTITNITLFAFNDANELLPRQDLLVRLNLKQPELTMYFNNLTDIITLTAKPIVSNSGGGATDMAFLVLGVLIGAAGLFGILLLFFYWRQRLVAEAQGDQGDLINDEDAASNSEVEGSDEEDAAMNELRAEETVGDFGDQMQMNPWMGMMNPMMFSNPMMFYGGGNEAFFNPNQMNQGQGQDRGQPMEGNQ